MGKETSDTARKKKDQLKGMLIRELSVDHKAILVAADRVSQKVTTNKRTTFAYSTNLLILLTAEVAQCGRCRVRCPGYQRHDTSISRQMP